MVGHPVCRVLLVAVLVMAHAGSGTAGASARATAERSVPAAAAAVAVPLNDCVIPDNRLPLLRGLTLSPARLDLSRRPQRLTVRANVVDIGGPGPASGIRSVDVYLGNTKHPVTPVGTAFVGLRPRPDGSWSGSHRFFPGTAPGRWVIEVVRVKDKAGLVKTLRHAALTRLGITPRFIVTGPTDRANPRLFALHVSRTVLHLRPGHGGSVRVRATASDDVYLQDVSVSAAVGFARGTFVELRRATSGSWVGRLKFPRWNVRGHYRLEVLLEDGIFGVSIYGGDPSNSDGPIPGPDTITVRGGLEDHSPPHILFTQLPTSPIDLRTTDQVITIQARIRDTGSGVSNAQLRLDATQPVIVLREISGTRHDGLWQVQARLSHCTPPSDLGFDVFADDVAGHQTSLGHTALRVITSDHTPPGVNFETFNPERTGPLRFEWNEDVAGISAQTAPLFPDDTAPLFPGGRVSARVPVPGAWTCQTATGAQVACVTGPVRVSTFTPSVRLTATDYVMAFNPRGILSVTDLAGNPASPFGWEE